jgi:hypothetical protein
VRGWGVNILEDARHWIDLLQYNLFLVGSTYKSVVDPDLAFQVNPDPDPGLDDQKLKKKIQLKIKFVFI